MQQECLCSYCTATIEESDLYFAFFCDYDVSEHTAERHRPIAAAPTVHLDELYEVLRQQELSRLRNDNGF